MNISMKTTVIIAIAFAVLLLLFFGGGMSGGAMMGSGMAGAGSMSGVVWMWLPMLLVALIGVVFFSIFFKNRKN
jgi:hypothetical protein